MEEESRFAVIKEKDLNMLFIKKELFKLIDNYFNKYPLRTAKMEKVNLIKDFFVFKLNENNLGLAERMREEAK